MGKIRGEVYLSDGKDDLTDDFILEQAFPEAIFPILPEMNQKDYEIANELCPILYVDPILFKKEKIVLRRNLGLSTPKFSGLICGIESLLPANPELD
jgi:hypothetical protein